MQARHDGTDRDLESVRYLFICHALNGVQEKDGPVFLRELLERLEVPLPQLPLLQAPSGVRRPGCPADLRLGVHVVLEGDDLLAGPPAAEVDREVDRDPREPGIEPRLALEAGEVL